MYKHQMEMRGLQHNVVHTFYHKISDSSIPDQGSSSYIFFCKPNIRVIFYMTWLIQSNMDFAHGLFTVSHLGFIMYSFLKI